MNNFELQEQAEFMVDTHTPLQLARMLLQAREDLKELSNLLIDAECYLDNVNDEC